jgi:CheY-like chemotaxis protein
MLRMTTLTKLTILIVEDDPDARELLSAVLEQQGANVLCADSVATAFTLLDGARPDVIISDIAMPEEDGIAFIRRLRSHPAERGGQTPAIAVSAYVGASDRARASAAGFDRYLCKPIDFEKLITTIHDVVTRENQATA